MYFLCLCKVKKTFGRFQVDATKAYKCKQILGLCHSPPGMENQRSLWKKNLLLTRNGIPLKACHQEPSDERLEIATDGFLMKSSSIAGKSRSVVAEAALLLLMWMLLPTITSNARLRVAVAAKPRKTGNFRLRL